MTTGTYYVCPDCGEYSGNMNLANEQYEPTEADLKARPWAADIGNEVLICTVCKKTHTWFTLEERGTMARPIIVCLCGSTRFWRTFQRAALQETLAGKIVLSIGAASGTDDDHFGNLPKAEYDRVKAMLDELHLRKIDLADEVLILDIGGYIGESTSRELAYAKQHRKLIRYWSQEDGNTTTRPST